MNVFLILASAVSAFLGSGVASAIATHYLANRRAREEVLRSKLEELFLATSGYCLQLSASSLPYLRAMHGAISYDEANQISTDSLDRSQRHFERAQMLINLYYPKALELFDKLTAARDKANDVRSNFKLHYAEVQRSPEHAKRFKEALEEFDEIGNLIRFALTRISADLIRPPSMIAKAKRWSRKHDGLSFDPPSNQDTASR
jgi:hypothetical protein